MKKIVSIIFIIACLSFAVNQVVYARSCEELYDLTFDISPNNPLVLDRDGDNVTFNVTDHTGQLKYEYGEDAAYRIVLSAFQGERFPINQDKSEPSSFTYNGDVGTASFSKEIYDPLAVDLYVAIYKEATPDVPICTSDRKLEVHKTSSGEDSCQFNFYQTNPKDNIERENPACVDRRSPVRIQVNNVIHNGQLYTDTTAVYFKSNPSNASIIDISNGRSQLVSLSVPNAPSDNNALIIGDVGSGGVVCKTADVIQVRAKCDPEDQESKVNSTLADFNLCNNINDIQCTNCLSKKGVWTALGCIRFSPGDFVRDFMSIALGIAGGIALLLMIYGAFLISTSMGDPKKAEEGKEIITGTIAGLLFIIFSVVLLKFIGVEIFSLPGF